MYWQLHLLYYQSMENPKAAIFIISKSSVNHSLSMIDIGIYWAIYLLIIGFGIARLAFIFLGKERLCGIISKASAAAGAAAICLFAAAREPYVTILLFCFLQ
ncbi:MAG: hypothetical protein ACLTW9_14835 [Enterocloster sp.]